MLKTWKKDELIEINGKFVEREWAFPDLEGNQTAVMLRWVDGKWEFSLWGSAFDANGVVACGWEPCWEGDRQDVSMRIDEIMKSIENGD